jgi:LAO/AO transport system kinase
MPMLRTLRGASLDAASSARPASVSFSTADVVTVLDAMGHDVVIIETVGVGQDEVDVMKAAHTSVVVTVPGLGDDIQAIKAGILEIADVLAVNKADREGADRTERDLMHMLDLRAEGERKEVEIIRTIANRGLGTGSGIPELADAIERHRTRVWTGDSGVERATDRARAQISELVRALLADKADRALAASGGLGELSSDVVERKRDPWTIAETLVGGM